MLHDGLATLELTVKVEKEKLLQILRDNLEKHKKEHAEARAGWHTRLIEQLGATVSNAESMLLSAQSGRDGNEGPKDDDWKKQFPDVSDLIPEDWHDEPISFAKQYEDAIGMLEMADDTDRAISLSRTLYKQLVQDDWSWKESHVVSMMKYSGRLELGKR